MGCLWALSGLHSNVKMSRSGYIGRSSLRIALILGVPHPATPTTTITSSHRNHTHFHTILSRSTIYQTNLPTTMSTIVTPLAAGVTRDAVIAVLHQHESYIKITCPQLIDYKHISGTPGVGNTCVCTSPTSPKNTKNKYKENQHPAPPPPNLTSIINFFFLSYPADEVTDKRPIGQTTFTLNLVDTDNGINAVIDGKAPTGSYHIESKWTVHADKIEEEVSFDANMLMKKMIKGSVEKSHPEQHQGFVQAAKA